MTAAQFIVCISIVCALIPLCLTYKAEGKFGKYTTLSFVFISLWMGITFLIGKYHFVSDFSSSPPKFIFLLISIFTLVFLIVRSPHGSLIIKKTSTNTLIGLQSFRILPELFLDKAYQEGLAPIQMTYYGRNFDILVAIAALVILIFRKKINLSSKTLAYLFNAFGLLLLSNIVITAILSMPTKFRYFTNEPANIFITQAPYIWLPTVLVFLALWGHFILYRKLMTKEDDI